MPAFGYHYCEYKRAVKEGCVETLSITTAESKLAIMLKKVLEWDQLQLGIFDRLTPSVSRGASSYDNNIILI